MSKSNTQFQGIITYPITPFLPNGEIDLKTLNQLIEQLISNGSHAIAPLGSTGESAYLNDEEWTEVAQTSIKAVAKRLPVIVGVSDLTTANAVKRAKIAEKAGADAIMVLPVSYWKLSNDEIFSHYAKIADAVSLPIMVYNNPATSGIDMSPEFIVQMFKSIDNVTMVKESTGDIQRMHKIRLLANNELPFYNGSNPLALEAFAAGASGWCTAAPNIIPQWPMKLYQAFQNNDLPLARDLFYKQLPLLEFILKGGLPTTIKAGLKLKGLNVGSPRLPLQPLDEAGTKKLETLLESLHKTQ
ncbi:MAG: dihydrodipicolinate synthase family protein [Cellvibrio sp.]|uniref:dihydrodipicolinate synthase family protein n=1 Tax=Cellvibrio sp. TaxID=1965322 RepID=UPI0031B10BE5